jgi:4-hydroxy-tetrahydrodipicolinate synthase
VNVGAIRRLYDAQSKDEAERLHAGVSAVRTILEARPLIPALKALMAAATGKPDWAVLRPPLRPLGPDAVQALIAELRRAGLDLDILSEGAPGRPA